MIGKNVTIFFVGLLIGMFTVGEATAQAEFETGKFGVNLNNFGRIRVLSPDFDGMRQLDRASIIIGVSPTEVYSYNNDADTEIAPANITPPTVGDFEIFGAFNNDYSGDPPDVIVETSIYGWQDKEFALIKFVVNNNEADAINAAIGIEILPQVDGAYGDEFVDFITAEGIVSIHKTSYVGFKLLSDDVHTLNIIDWASGYDSDKSDLYSYITEGTIAESYEATEDGTVIFVIQDKVNIEAGASTEVYFAFAIADDESGLINAIAEAQDEYDEVTSIVVQPGTIPDTYSLTQNYPNPFNPVTTINFSIPIEGHVNLTIHNVVGQLVTMLVDDSLPAGEYSVTFDAAQLPSGVYIYTLSAGEFQSTKRMMFVK